MYNIAAGGFSDVIDGYIATNGESATVAALIDGSGLNPMFLGSPLYSNEQFSANLVARILPSLDDATEAMVATIVANYMTANPTMSRVDVIVALIEAVAAYPAAEPVLGAATAAFNARVALSDAYTGTSTDFTVLSTVIGENAGETILLGVDTDDLMGGLGNDTFNAYIYDNQNSLQSGDMINGGAGNDTLFADIGDSQNFAITPITTSIETAQFRVQAGQVDSGDNNVQSWGVIDAQRMVGVNTYEDLSSRADLVVEDIRILDNQITKDITIIMRDTDPGHVDYGVYFDQNSLRNVTDSTSIMNLRVLDTNNTNLGNDPLTDSPYGSFTFSWSSDGGTTFTQTTLASAAMQSATTFAEMIAAMQAAADAVFGAGAVVVAAGINYSVPDSVSGNDVTGTEITITANASIVFDTTVAGSGWLATETVPAVSGLYTSFNQDTTAATDLVTSTVILDNVGRGSNGGDLVIGGLSVGDTSNSHGVQQFDITVEDSSRLQTINSTNNTLQEVYIVNGVANEMDDAYRNAANGNSPSEGQLEVWGTQGVTTGINDNLPGSAAQHDGGYGFSDVRVIDGSAMTGSLEFSAEITNAAIAKYLDLIDIDGNPAADNIDVLYSGGSNDDVMEVDMDADATASQSNINVGREDFTFVYSGNGGDDEINVAVDRGNDNLIGDGEFVAGGTNGGDTEAWYLHQKMNANISIDGGAGNDTIRKPGAGDLIIDGGSGNDTIYSDNSGSLEQAAGVPVTSTSGAQVLTAPRAVWVLNTANQTAGAMVEKILTDIVSDTNERHFLYKADVTVTFRGLTATAAIASTGYLSSDLQVNQAIKNAINNDAVLSKLLIAEDGPANSLVITSLIDGTSVDADLAIAIAAPATTEITTAEEAAIATAWAAAAAAGTVPAAEAALVPAAASADTAAEIVAVMTNGAGPIANMTGTAADDYFAVLANTSTGVVTTGDDSNTTSDNVIEGGTGDDVMVLGTTGDAIGDVAYLARTDVTQNPFSNEVVIYTAAFDDDTIVNFKADTDAGAGEFSAGYDVLNFRAFLGSTATTLGVNQATAGAVASTDSLIQTGTFDNTGAALTGVRNDSAAEVKALYTDDVTANKGVYITVSAANIGTVYAVVDGTGATDLTVTLMGTIDLADTAWGTLTIGNFA